MKIHINKHIKLKNILYKTFMILSMYHDSTMLSEKIFLISLSLNLVSSSVSKIIFSTVYLLSTNGISIWRYILIGSRSSRVSIRWIRLIWSRISRNIRGGITGVSSIWDIRRCIWLSYFSDNISLIFLDDILLDIRRSTISNESWFFLLILILFSFNFSL